MYEITYWLPGQSRLFSLPKHYVTESKKEFLETLDKAKKCGYDIEYATTVYRETLMAMTNDDLFREWGRILERDSKDLMRDFAEEALSRIDRR